MDANTITDAAFLPQLDPAWEVAAIADFDGDGRSDLLFHRSSGAHLLWTMDGAHVSGGYELPTADPAWSVAGAADFDGDGQADVLLRHPDGSAVIWLLAGTIVETDAHLPALPSIWAVAGLGDLDGDGKADIVLRQVDGSMAVWTMDGGIVVGGHTLPNIGADWFIAAVVDFDADGKSDLLLQKNDGTTAVWRMDGPTIAVGEMLQPIAADRWTAGAGDFDGDGNADILLRQADGRSGIRIVNGAFATADGDLALPQLAPAWYSCQGDGPVLVYTCTDVLPSEASTCADPMPLTPPVALRGSVAGHPDECIGACIGQVVCDDRGFAYSVVVPAGETLNATLRTFLTPTLQATPRIFIGAACDDVDTCEWAQFGPSGFHQVTTSWTNTTASPTTVVVAGRDVVAPAYDLALEFGAAVPDVPACGPGLIWLGGACTSIAQSCPLPRVTLDDGACASPDRTSASCGCGGACDDTDSCVDGACVAAQPGERCELPLDYAPPGMGWAFLEADAQGADASAVPSPFGGQVYAVDHTWRFTQPLADTCLAMKAFPVGEHVKHTRDGWLLVEAFDESGCNGAPMASKTIPPFRGIMDLPEVFVVPAGATRLRMQFVALDDQGPIHFMAQNHPYFGLCP